MKVQKQKNPIIIRIAAAAFAVYLVVTLVSQQMDIRKQKAVLAEVQQQCDAQKIENMEVERLLSQDNEEAYVERIARDKLDYAYPDEKVFVDVSGN